MKKKLTTLADVTIVIYLIILFIARIFVVEINIGFPNSIVVLSRISNTIPLILVGLLIGLLKKENIAESIYPIRLNNGFRIMIIIQIVFHLILWNDFFQHPLSYDFKNVSFRRYFIKDLPLYVWLLRVYFQRWTAIENQLTQLQKNGLDK